MATLYYQTTWPIRFSNVHDCIHADDGLNEDRIRVKKMSEMSFVVSEIRTEQFAHIEPVSGPRLAAAPEAGIEPAGSRSLKLTSISRSRSLSFHDNSSSRAWLPTALAGNSAISSPSAR